jgi:hypothetical protein
LAVGAEVTEAIVNKTNSNLLGAREDLMVEHGNQTVLVFTPGAAILARRDRKTGAFSASVHHPSPQKLLHLPHYITFCIDMTKALKYKLFLDRVQELIAENAPASKNITPALTQATRNRPGEMIDQIDNFKK